MKKKTDKQNSTTDSGEFVPTAFSWNTLDSQKHRAKELQSKTRNKKRK